MKTVLIVDDNPVNIRILKMLLVRQGCIVHDFNHPHDALQWIDKQPLSVDLAILDFEMDELNGDELAAGMRKAGFQGNCLILTALGTLDKSLLAAGSRIQAIINKPINLTDINYILKRWATLGQELDARAEERDDSDATGEQEIFLFQNGVYHSLKVQQINNSNGGNGYVLINGIQPKPGSEMMRGDGQNLSIRWVKPFQSSSRFGACVIEEIH